MVFRTLGLSRSATFIQEEIAMAIAALAIALGYLPYHVCGLVCLGS